MLFKIEVSWWYRWSLFTQQNILKTFIDRICLWIKIFHVILISQFTFHNHENKILLPFMIDRRWTWIVELRVQICGLWLSNQCNKVWWKPTATKSKPITWWLLRCSRVLLVVVLVVELMVVAICMLALVFRQNHSPYWPLRSPWHRQERVVLILQLFSVAFQVYELQEHLPWCWWFYYRMRCCSSYHETEMYELMSRCLLLFKFGDIENRWIWTLKLK